MAQMADNPSGRELGRRIVTALRAYVSRSLGEMAGRMESLQSSIAQTPTLEIVRGEIDVALSRFTPPPAIDGNAVTLDDVRPMMESALAAWALDFERRAQAVMERAIDRMPKPRDGENGKDGTNGVNGTDGEPGGSIEDFAIEVKDRTLAVGMKIGGRDVVQTVKLDMPIYRDVYQSGRKYEKGDMVTYSGSLFIAMEDTTEKPETSKEWKLAVKRGQNGKDGKDAPVPEAIES